MQVQNMNPNDYDPSDSENRSGHYDCIDGSFLDVVLEEGTDIYDVVVSGFDAVRNRSFVFTSYTMNDVRSVDRKITRCTG